MSTSIQLDVAIVLRNGGLRNRVLLNIERQEVAAAMCEICDVARWSAGQRVEESAETN